MADHNDPNAVNSIFSDIDVSAADLYDLFGFPSDDTTGGEKVVIALTFASVPETGVFDTDMLYKIQISAHPRVDLPSAMGEPDRARLWHEKALATYLESVQRGNVHYLHHLTEFYADVREDGAEAVRWARKDLELRQNFSTQAALAWALYRDDRFAVALDAMHKALSSGVRDAKLFFQAAEIHLAAGQTDEGKLLLRAAAEINPHYQDFHVHR